MKILVVEDEYYARKRIVKILKESDLDIEIVADVENGIYAKEIIKDSDDIDIIITDICMMEMDGLELAEYIYRSGKDIQVIIATAYGEFEYAKKAIEFQVKKFITKPIKKSELINDVLELIEQKRKDQTRIKKVCNDYMKKFSQKYISFKDIVGDPELSDQFFSLTRIREDNLFFRVVIFQFEQNAIEKDMKYIKAGICHILKLQKYDLFYLKKNDEFILIYCSSREDLFSEKVKNDFNNLLNYLRTITKYTITVGIGGVYSKIENLYSSYKEAVYAINQRLIKGWNKIFVYDLISFQHKGKSDVPNENTILSVIETASYADLKQYIHDIIMKFCSQDSNILELFEVLVNILKAFNIYIRDSNNDEFGTREKMEILFSEVSLYNYKNIQDIESYILLLLSNIYHNKNGACSNINPIINNILRYIERNYQYDISLQDLAENRYFVNYSYLSRVFKKQVGKSFSKYLTDIRIEKSKELLLSSMMKINDIATLVGYNSVSHYIQSFRKSVGITPNDYRNKKINA